MRGRVMWWLSAVSLLAFLGCASWKKKEDIKPVWPPPPQTERIRFLRLIESSDDIEREVSVFRRLLRLVGGRKAPTFTLREPMGIAVSDDGQRIYVSDPAQAAVFIFDFGEKTFDKIVGLNSPMGIALDEDENLFVVEQRKKGVSIFNREHQIVGFFTDASLHRPTGIVIDRDRDRIYVADTSSMESREHTVKVFDREGKLVGVVGKNRGGGEGQFLFPTYLALDKEGNLFVSDTLNARVQKFDPDGNFVRVFGERGTGWGMFDKPKGIAIDSLDNLYIVDTTWCNVQIFNQRGDVLLFFGGRGPLPGMLKNPTAIAIDKDDRIFVCDFLNHRIGVYQLVNTTKEDSYPDLPEEGPEQPDAGGNPSGETAGGT